MNIVFPTGCAISKHNLSQLIRQRFGHVSISRLKLMTIKWLNKVLPKNLPDLEDPCPIFLLTKATKITRGPSTDVLKSAPGFMLQIDFDFFNAENVQRIYLDFCGYMFW